MRPSCSHHRIENARLLLKLTIDTGLLCECLLRCAGYQNPCHLKVVIGDGAEWIWNLADLHFPGAPELRKRQRANEAELQSLEMTAVDPNRNLRLVETLAEFRTRLRARGNVLEVAERQRVVRLLVQEILVGRDNIKSAIPLPCRLLRPTRTMEFGQAVNRPSPIPAHVTFCVQTVYTPATM